MVVVVVAMKEEWGIFWVDFGGVLGRERWNGEKGRGFLEY